MPKPGVFNLFTSLWRKPKVQETLVSSRYDDMGPYEYVPFGPSTPDVFEADPICRFEIGKFVGFGFRNIEPLAARGGGQSMFKYPLVLAVFDPEAPKGHHGTVFFFAVELGNLLGTSCLGGYDGSGKHLNYGTCDPNIEHEEFFEIALLKSKNILGVL